ERRLPQDGRIRIKVDGRELDLRVATMPVAFGEGVHIRILTSRLFLELEKLGFLPENLAIIEQALRKQHGIIFVTGPTGSGKSTTLYAALARLNHPTRKIITIEDPIEYQMYGVNQMQINPAVGLSFAASLRNVLRHDPDILMVGEVRDRETADIAIRSALTGHLVFSSLHTNDAAGTVTRLLDMGIEPFLVASSLECLIAQRLVRLICPECKEPVEGSENPGGQVFYEGKGCPACRFTGYRGRTGIHEIVPMSEAIRTMILKNASSQEIKEKAVAEGMVTLREDGFKKAAMGLTTTTEVFRVTQQDDT
ncbi:MAG: GspE/PulE family protein, partial [Candidatus Omnitrophica bacterium]|nr:GspE/PulE family protein [Candidatus Omnitrophota bacterium]